MTTVNVSGLSGRTVQLSYLGAFSGSMSISAADDITADGQTATFTLANNAGAPTGATLNGVDVGALTDQGSGVYSYTAPLIADDATADLVVSVDSTTVSAVVSYANSYPYELVTHGTPDANSIFFGTQFATTGPVEWGVVTDYNSAIVTVDHAAMDSAEDELNDVDLNSTEVAEGSSTATYKYFVPESGATGTFQATITVAAAVDTPPDQFDLGANVTGAEPGATVQRTFVLAGIDAGETVSVTATGSATVSPSTVQVGDTITVSLTAGTFEAVVTGGVTISGVSDSFSATTRAAVLPTQDVVLSDLSLGETDAVSIDFDNYFSGATSYTVSGIPASSGLSFAGSVLSGNVNANDVAASPLNLTVTAFSAEGSIQDVFSVTVADTIKPVITPPSPNPLYIVVGGTFTNTPATAFDSVDGDLGNVAGVHSVDENTIGQYTITYRGAGVVDSAGNVAEDATRTVNVVAEDFWPFCKGIKHAATKNWTWGSRHPITGMRVRIFK